MVTMNDMSRDQLFVWVADLLAEMFELDRDALTPASNLYTDLDIDSIDAVDLAVKLKQTDRQAPAAGSVQDHPHDRRRGQRAGRPDGRAGGLTSCCGMR
jgi:hypothetical protein